MAKEVNRVRSVLLRIHFGLIRVGFIILNLLIIGKLPLLYKAGNIAQLKFFRVKMSLKNFDWTIFPDFYNSGNKSKIVFCCKMCFLKSEAKWVRISYQYLLIIKMIF